MSRRCLLDLGCGTGELSAYLAELVGQDGKVVAVHLFTTSRRFKCVPTVRGSLSIHLFMLLFRFIAESSVFSSDFTRECKTAIEIGAPFEEMCETFLLFSAEKRTVALIPIIVL